MFFDSKILQIIILKTLLIFLLNLTSKLNFMKTLCLTACLSIILLSSCTKDESQTGNTTDTTTYINTIEGSSWTYHEINSSGLQPVNSDYTVTSTSKDTSINGKSYHVYNYSYGGSRYLNMSGHEYFQFDSLPGGLGEVFDRLYLKDNVSVGSKWDQSLSVSVPGVQFPVPVTITNKISEKGISREVNGITYTNVIHVTTSITSALIPSNALTSSIDSYYAEKFGLIENSSIVLLDFFGITNKVDIVTKLTSATLK